MTNPQQTLSSMVNRIGSLISLSVLSLLVYKNARDFYAYFYFFFDSFCDLLVIQQRVVQPPYVGVFNSFSPVIDI